MGLGLTETDRKRDESERSGVMTKGAHLAYQPEERDTTWRYVLALCGFCLLGYALVVAPVLTRGYALIWKFDGLQQELISQIYIGKQLRRAFRSLLAGKGFAFDQFIFGLAYGVDGSSVAKAWNPLSWLYCFVPTRFSEYFYYVVIYIRIVLAALAFSAYCHHRGYKRDAALVASLCYAFNGFTLFWALLRHPQYLDIVYAFPLVMLGTDKLFDENKPLLFVLTLAYTCLLTPYFTYMVSLAVFIYCLFKFAFREGPRTVQAFISIVLKFLLYGVIGVCLSAVASLPYIVSVVSVDRLAVKRVIPQLYGYGTYLSALTNSIGGAAAWNGRVRYIGPLSVILLFFFLRCRSNFTKREHTAWALGLAFVVICTLFPFFGRVFNGFSYTTDRWYFILNFVISYIVCITIPILPNLSKRDWFFCFLLVVAYSLLSLAPLPSQTNDVSIVFAALVLCSSYFALMTTTLNGDATHPNSTLIAVVLLSAAFASFSVCSVAPMGGDDVTQFFKPIGGAHDFYYENNPFQAMDTLPKDERRSYRYSYPDRDAFSYRLNDSLIHDRSGLSSYTSLYNQSINDFRDEMGLSESSFSAIMTGSDSRLALEAFAGAKYFFADEDNAWLVPATYAAVGESGDTGSQLYQTEYALPAGFIYKNTIERDVYDNLSMIEKQEALLNGCVLENANPSSPTLSSSDLDITSVRVPYTHNAEEGIQLEEGTITVSKRGSKLTLLFDGLADAETYLTFSNLQYVPEEPSLSDAESLEDSIEILRKGYYPSSFTFSVSSELGKTSVLSYTPMDFRYCGRSDWAVNAGYSEDGLSELTLAFNRAGTYTFDDLSVVCQPMEPIKSKLSALQSRGLSDVVKGNNQITAVARTTSEIEYALFTTAYSSGWSATVDGQEAEVLKGDTGFIALELTGPGEHEICLTYCSPGFKSGVIVTIGSAAAMVLIGYAKRHRKDRTDS